MNEGIAIDKPKRSAGGFDVGSKMFSLNGPIDQSNDTSEAAERDGSYHIPSLSLLLLSYATCLAHHVNESHDQRSKADTAKGVCESSPCGAPCGTAWHSTWFPSTEKPAAIDTSDDGVDRVLEPNGVDKLAVFPKGIRVFRSKSVVQNTQGISLRSETFHRGVQGGISTIR